MDPEISLNALHYAGSKADQVELKAKARTATAMSGASSGFDVLISSATDAVRAKSPAR